MNTNERAPRMSDEVLISLMLHALEKADPAFEKLVGFFRENISGEGICLIPTNGKDKKILAPASVVFATGSLYRTPHLAICDHGKKAIRMDIGSCREALLAHDESVSYAIATKGNRHLDIYKGDFKFKPPDVYVKWLDKGLRELEAMRIDRPINTSTNPSETQGPTF